MIVECVVAAGNRLGESPVWCDRRRRLFWVDSRAPAIHWLDPETGGTGSAVVSELIGSIGLVDGDDRLIAAMESGFFLIDPSTGAASVLATVAMPAGHRFNDGRVDRQGRFWAGTMNDRERIPTGALYRLDADRTVTLVLSDVIVPNSLGWSPDSTTMYFGDTYRHQIYAFPFAPGSGTIGERRLFADRTGERGRPDGSAVDAEGCLWNAEYAGGQVVRYTPEGRIDRVIPMPVSNPTCCAFGGPGLESLYVASAAQRLSPEQLALEPQAGGLFAFRPGVAGLPEPRYRGVGR